MDVREKAPQIIEIARFSPENGLARRARNPLDLV
jgi:hypothetical protein